jgi:transcription antitermination factor NusG
MLVSVVSITCAGLFAGSADALSVVEGILAIAAAYGLGALLGMLILGRLLYPVARWLAGAPFGVGDKVMILRGPRTRKTAEVYEVWESRGQVRLRLSDEERDAVADVFECYEVFKIKEPNEQG